MKPVFGIRNAEVYLDNAATTKVAPEVFDEMHPWLEEHYGNPDALYHKGLQAKEAVEKARSQIADLLECPAKCINFTSGGTEANNWVLKVISAPKDGVASFITSAIEHRSVLAPLEFLKTFGLNVSVVSVDSTGRLNMDKLEEALGRKPTMVSIQYANNETGVIQDIKRIAEWTHAAGSLLHVDAVQAVGKVDVFPIIDQIDLMSISAHKIHGPKGIGCLYVAEKLGEFNPFIHGGQQEEGHRAGTLPVHQIVGFGKAADLVRCSMKTEAPRQAKLLNWLAMDMYDKTGALRNGNRDNQLPNIMNMTFPAIDGAMLVSILSEKFGICVATAAACTRGNPSHVLMAMGMQPRAVSSSLRISIGRYTTDEHIKYFAACIQSAIKFTKEKT
jgi:cysteine desulfurase